MQAATTSAPVTSSPGTLITIGAVAGPISLLATGIQGFYLTKQLSNLREVHQKLEETVLDMSDTLLSQSDAYDHLSEIHGVVVRHGKLLEQHHSIVAQLEGDMKRLDKAVKGILAHLDSAGGRAKPRRAYEEDLDYEYERAPVLAPPPKVQRFKPPPVARNLAPKPRTVTRQPAPPVIETDDDDEFESDEDVEIREKPQITQAEADELDMILDD